ncbi:MAG: DMT family transporter [Candidatus Bipolaricaulota bacterium]
MGELAALGVSILWTGSYLAFTSSVRRIGADAVNQLRLAMALVLLLMTHTAVYGVPLPPSASLSRWGWLSLSGIVGFAFCDAFLFRALRDLGAHRTSVVSALIPVTSALFALAVFGERLLATQWLGVALTVAALFLVISARRAPLGPEMASRYWRGLGFALIAVIAQASRYLLSVKGMEGGFPPLSTNVIQILAATAASWASSLPRRRWREAWRAAHDRRAMTTTALGAFMGPFLGVTGSLVALSSTSVGVASTLMALSPVFLLPLSAVLFRERVTWRGAIGTALAVGGVALLFLG